MHHPQNRIPGFKRCGFPRSATHDTLPVVSRSGVCRQSRCHATFSCVSWWAARFAPTSGAPGTGR
ncbi:hypothetical protein Ga0080574_TMP1119 [Salipiger abyssi]|uniref:Uncharacterized protein n=1 Tax=Salipiger abyssi TaxID=1250539 RepID=A0A1P8UPX6_9RHOB|nr:hypothetical protein Ga0080574_TMP1119 [Salipiger abyssi]